MNWAIPTVKGFKAFSLIAISGHKKLFQFVINIRIVTVESAGLESGSMILAKIPKS
ncbi:hypothetical protein D3C71_2249770 [compost metagenome]